MASFGLRVIRSLFGLAEHVAPRLAGRAAFELFCRTPSPKSLTSGERRAIDRAQDFMAQARHHRVGAGRGCVVVHEFRPEPGRAAIGTVLVIHGWRSRTEYMKSLIEGYRAAGYRVMSLDLPGHGQSSGRRLTMVNAVDAARAAGEWFGPFAAIVGHSFGGAVAVNAFVGSVAGVPPLAAERLVLIAAPNAMSKVFEGFGHYINLGSRSFSAMAEEVERIAGRPLAEFVSSRQLAKMPIPALVLHAPDDREVSADNAETLASAGDHVRLSWTPGLGHRRILSDPAVARKPSAFLRKAGSVCPFIDAEFSGAGPFAQGAIGVEIYRIVTGVEQAVVITINCYPQRGFTYKKNIITKKKSNIVVINGCPISTLSLFGIFSAKSPRNMPTPLSLSKSQPFLL